MRDLVKTYLRQRKAEGMSDGTVRERRRRLEWLLEFLERRGRKRMADVRPLDIDAYLDRLRARKLKPSYRRDLTVTVRSFFTWLGETGRILSNPARHVALQNEQEGALLEPPLNEEEVATILNKMPRDSVIALRNVLIVDLLYSCGLRRAEVLALDVRDIDLSNRLVHVRRGKGSKPRTVPAMGGVCGNLRDYLALRRTLLKGADHGALLLTRSGRRTSKRCLVHVMDAINRGKYIKRHVHAHLFRHSIALALLRGGADIRFVQAFLGHSSIDTTRTYLRLVVSDLRAGYDGAMPHIVVEPG